MDISKHSTGSYKGPQTEEAKENVKKFWEQIAQAKIDKLNKELLSG